ncbi:hypothetical protein [Paludisphaera rhizosphaerae]|uniref:hypothetical protein n=1 Tax=Paludisphaera rhizosphaerae TaxID=2711216 RepID=UPI0013EAE0A7|nr:hypothetical protein [Paludisphaera rhizosphaerae]
MERRFSLADGMVLMVGLGLGLALMKVADMDRELARSWSRLTGDGMHWSLKNLLEAASEWGLFLGLPLGAGLTPFCLYYQSRGRPGYAACLIATVVLVPTLVLSGLLVALNGKRPNDYLAWHAVTTPLIGSAILSSWATLRLVGVWNPAPSWQDRLGRALGVLWIALGAMAAFLLCTQLV